MVQGRNDRKNQTSCVILFHTSWLLVSHRKPYSMYKWRIRRTHQQAMVCCHCWIGAESEVSELIAVAPEAGG